MKPRYGIWRAADGTYGPGWLTRPTGVVLTFKRRDLAAAQIHAFGTAWTFREKLEAKMIGPGGLPAAPEEGDL